ncbi:U32 family peptidase [bacterium]|nr:U32 family peptidase [candidate division CSSED10-310 bacterium]
MNHTNLKILAPVNCAAEVKKIVQAGAEELYCGVMPHVWRERYSNVASMNRREWKVSNIADLDEFRRVIEMSHEVGARVYMTMNALYTEGQYGMVLETIERAMVMGVDAFIVADIGLLVTLRERGLRPELHMSTGGTTFNTATARFYRSLGVTRIIVPRHITIAEAADLAARDPDLHFELFGLNRGCKNIDGFCTFHHGVNEVRLGRIWDIPKKMNLDQKMLNWMRRLPRRVAEPLARARLFGSVGACFLGYDVTTATERERSAELVDVATRNVRDTFNLLTGIDTCGACRIGDMAAAGIHSIKIVGRENLTPKKVQDTRFLDQARSYFAVQPAGDHRRHEPEIRRIYKDVYGFDCGRRCYYPD